MQGCQTKDIGDNTIDGIRCCCGDAQQVVIKQGGYTVSLECRSVSGESGHGGAFMDEKYDILQKEKRRLLQEIRRIDEQLKGCARIVRKR